MNIFKITLGILLLTGLIFSFGCGNSGSQQGTGHDDHHQHNQQARTAAETGGTAAITFENTEFDFGTINEGDMVHHTYRFTNTGSVPLVIQNASPSCGCTVPNWPKEPIPPGGTGEIEVAFDSKGKSETQNRTVNIVANTEPSITQLRIKGVVIAKATQAMGPVRKN